MDPIVIGLWKLKQQMNNMIQPFTFHKDILDQISEEIEILQKEQSHCEDKNIFEFHKNTLNRLSEEIKALQNI